LVALSADAAGTLSESLVTVATIIEMVHLATLVHDDVMDEASVRRCRPTLAANWGNEVSVLLGDCLFAHALHLAASFPTPDVCRSVSAATRTVCSGEILQTHQRGRFDLSRSDYFKVLRMKTGELFALSCDLGSKLAGASNSHRLALRQYGLVLGTAYQIFDDCVDVFGSESSSGKSLGTDLASGKPTLPVLVALERASVSDRAELSACLQQWDAQFFPYLRTLLDKYDAQNECRQVVREFLASATGSLECLPDSPSRRSLNVLAQYLSEQTDSLGVPS
jgi:octaprenyl-diphosphate synthase